MLFQKEKDYGNTITKIGRKKNKKNETAKKKRKIKKERKCSLKNRILASSMVRRISNLFLNTSSEKASFCTSFPWGGSSPPVFPEIHLNPVFKYNCTALSPKKSAFGLPLHPQIFQPLLCSSPAGNLPFLLYCGFPLRSCPYLLSA